MVEADPHQGGELRGFGLVVVYDAGLKVVVSLLEKDSVLSTGPISRSDTQESRYRVVLPR